MELGLQFEEIVCYEPTAKVSTTHEESMETVIPEYCPDVARIVDAVGELFIREKSVSEDKCTVSGAVKVTVLYTSEETAGLRSLSLSVPFLCALEDRMLCASAVIRTEGRILLTEVKAATSRKLYIKVLPEITAAGYREVKHALCRETQPEPSLRVRQREVTLRLLGAVEERENSFFQETSADGVPMPEDLLLHRLCPTVQTVQHLGNKLVVKGEMTLSLLYRDAERTLRRHEASLPFSQILECPSLPEDADFVVQPRLSDSDVRLLRTEGGAGFGVTAQISFFVQAYRCITTCIVSDLYSTCAEAEIKRQTIVIPEATPPKLLPQEAVQRLEFTHSDPFVFVTALDCAPAVVSAEENGAMLHTTLHIRILYLDESGTAVGTERSVELSIPTAKAGGPVEVSCGSAAVQGGGTSCQLRATVIFSVGCGGEQTLSAITAVSLQTVQPRGQCPSLILRRMRDGETLWDIAKQYRTDEETIRSANHLEGEAPAAEGMLLIPRLR